MKWFKHLSRALYDDMIFEAIEKFGGDGYMVFFGTLEMMSDGFDVNHPGECRISIKKMTGIYQISRQKLTKILAFFDQKSKEELTKDKSFSATIEKDTVYLRCHRLADLCDEHTQKLLKKNRESIGSQSGFTPSIEVRSKNKELESKDKSSLKADEPETPKPESPPPEARDKIKILRPDIMPPGPDQIQRDLILEMSVAMVNDTTVNVVNELVKSKIFSKAIEWLTRQRNMRRNPRAILHVLKQCLTYKPDKAWAYCDSIIEVENGNFNEQEHIRNHA